MYELQQFIPNGQAFPEAYFPQQFMPQGFLGNLMGPRLSDMVSCQRPSWGQRIGVGGAAMLPFGVDPAALGVANAQATAPGYDPQQFMPQSLFGGLLGQRFQQTYGCGPSGSLGQRTLPLLPFNVDPLALAYAQDPQLAYYQQQQQQQQQQLSPFAFDPLSAAYAYQQGQALQPMF